MKSGYFDSSEFASRDGAKSPYGPMNIRPELVCFLNQIREKFGKSIIVNSGYRSVEHNAAVGGVPNSYHTKGLAADIRPSDPVDLQELYELCDRMDRDGGVGHYDTFVHVDLRGKYARWDYRHRK